MLILDLALVTLLVVLDKAQVASQQELARVGLGMPLNVGLLPWPALGRFGCVPQDEVVAVHVVVVVQVQPRQRSRLVRSAFAQVPRSHVNRNGCGRRSMFENSSPQMLLGRSGCRWRGLALFA